MLGITNIKELLFYGFNLVLRAQEVTDEDSPGGKKVTWTEIVGSFMLLAKIPAMIGRAKEAWNEFLDLDPGEIETIKAEIAEKFDLGRDEVDELIGEVWTLLGQLAIVINKIKALKKA